MLSSATKYAINAVIYLASNASVDRKLSAKMVANAINIPTPFLAKLLQDLAKKKVITSAKGPKGGFYLTEKNMNAALINIVEQIDGLDKFDSCVLGLYECNPNNPCPIHFSITPFKNKLLADLTNNSIKDYAKGVQSGDSFLTTD